MLDRIQRTIQKRASGRAALVLLCVFGTFVVVLNFTDLPFGTRALAARSGGLAILDLRSAGYTPDEAYALFEALGTGGRRLYLCLILAADILLPLIGALFFAVCIAWLLGHFAGHHPVQRLILLPAVTMLADLAENACVLILLLVFPRRVGGLAWAASFFTLLKSGAGMLGVIVIVVCMLALVCRWVIRRSSTRK